MTCQLWSFSKDDLASSWIWYFLLSLEANQRDLSCISNSSLFGKNFIFVGMGQAGFCPSQVKSSFFENQNFKLKYFSNIWLSSLIKPSFFNYKIFKPSQAQISWVSSQVKSSIFNILIFKSNQVKLKLFDLTCQVAWTFFSKNLISIDLNWKNLYWNFKLT